MSHERPAGPFANQPKLDELAFEFFRLFSRMEYALKVTGYLKRPDGRAEADWNRFAKDVDETFLAELERSDELRKACDYLHAAPPKKQVARAGRLDWTEVKPQSNSTADLMHSYVRRIRNNLFHGGKFNGRWFDPERSELLLRHGLIILNYSLGMSGDVCAAYEH